MASRDNDDTLGVMAFPQVWFSKSEDGPFDKFRIDDIPTKDELIAKGCEIGSTLYVKTFETDDPSTLLESIGFRLANADWSQTGGPQGRVRIENVTRIAEPEFRAATKIALNYLAAVVGHDVARMPAFDDARNFARHGREKARVRAYPFENPWFIGRKGHYVSLNRSEEMIVAQLSILVKWINQADRSKRSRFRFIAVATSQYRAISRWGSGIMKRPSKRASRCATQSSLCLPLGSG